MYNPKLRNIIDILFRRMLDEADAEDLRQLREWADESPDNLDLIEKLGSGENIEYFLQNFGNLSDREMTRRVKRKLYAGTRRRLVAACVSAAAVLSAGIFLAIILYTSGPDTPSGYCEDNTALLILPDGTQVTLTADQQDDTWQELVNDPAILAHGEEAGGEPKILRIQIPRKGTFRVMLADGTRVWLNEETVFEYPQWFTGGTRNVSLEGEAYFEVVHDPARCFSVGLDNGATVGVLGTKFNINSYTDIQDIRVVLLEGSVEVKRDNNAVVLTPHNEAVMKRTGDGIAVNRVSGAEQYAEWIYGLFEFDYRPFGEIIEAVAGWYGLTPVFDPALSDRMGLLSLNIVRYEDHGRVFDKLEQITKLKFKVSGDRLHITE